MAGQSDHDHDIERHALVPLARHRALADADLLWQFWQRLHVHWPLIELREQVQRTMRRYRIAGEITEDLLYGPRSAVWDQAENRLHAQKALMALVVR